MRPKGCFIGLDPSYTGFGFVTHYEPSWVYDLKWFKWDVAKYASQGDRLAVIRDDLAAHLNTINDITLVAVEGYAHAAKYRREAMGELGGIVRLALNECARGAEWRHPLVVPPSTLKQYATDNGKASKDDMIKASWNKGGVKTNDHNLADAYLLSRFASEWYHRPEDPFFSKLPKPTRQ